MKGGHAQFYRAWELVFWEDLLTQASEKTELSVVEKVILIAARGNRLRQTGFGSEGQSTQEKYETAAR